MSGDVVQFPDRKREYRDELEWEAFNCIGAALVDIFERRRIPPARQFELLHELETPLDYVAHRLAKEMARGAS